MSEMVERIVTGAKGIHIVAADGTRKYVGTGEKVMVSPDTAEATKDRLSPVPVAEAQAQAAAAEESAAQVKESNDLKKKHD